MEIDQPYYKITKNKEIGNVFKCEKPKDEIEESLFKQCNRNIIFIQLTS